MSERFPDLSERPHGLKVTRLMSVPADRLFRAWTEQLDRWFADPGSVRLRAEVDEPFFFETAHRFESEEKARRHPHYGRFLRVEAERLLQFTWVTGENGTHGAETVVTIRFEGLGGTTRLTLAHDGFSDENSRDQHEKAWPFVLAQLEEFARSD